MGLSVGVLLSNCAFANITYAKTTKTPNEIYKVVVGAATQKTWTFEADKTGTYKIVFTYSRPWEKTASDKTVEYNVKVADENSAAATPIVLTADRENTIKRGQKFTVTLEENASTGYAWRYTIEANAINLINVETMNLVGAPTQKMWNFTANKKGTYKIKFTYARPWEKTDSDKTVEYTINVSNKKGEKLESVNLVEGKVNTINKGSEFVVVLEENASTGYSWTYAADKKAVTLNQEEIIEDMDGAPTQKMWTFEANKPGTYKIEYTYARPWEKTVDDKTVVYTVKVVDEQSTNSGIVALMEDKENTVKKGQKFMVTLEENASTGYEWNCNIEANAIKVIE
jgi:inhibitor of cysteine peptidase